jgi:hypothetical protein
MATNTNESELNKNKEAGRSTFDTAPPALHRAAAIAASSSWQSEPVFPLVEKSAASFQSLTNLSLWVSVWSQNYLLFCIFLKGG